MDLEQVNPMPINANELVAHRGYRANTLKIPFCL